MTFAASDGPESVGFSSSSPSTSAISDAVDWVQRLSRAFGSPNYCNYMELCGWGRYLAPLYTFGASVPGVYLPDLENAGCILFWGYNPSVARLAHATSTAAAVARGAKLIVVDPRKAGLASQGRPLAAGPTRHRRGARSVPHPRDDRERLVRRRLRPRLDQRC